MKKKIHLENNQYFFVKKDRKPSNYIIKTNQKLLGWKKNNILNLSDWWESPFNKNNRTTYNGYGAGYFFSKQDQFDVKEIWELSRFYWTTYISSLSLKDDEKVNTLNYYIEDWIKKNSPYSGINWACGQEASIRVLHLAFSALLLKQEQKITSGMEHLIRLHLKRIDLTIKYGISQDNNHGITESAALFVGGLWLKLAKDSFSDKWIKKGFSILESRVNKLIHSDGTFSMYSTNYHRMIIDTISIVEIWRRKFGEKSFSKSFYDKIDNAILWLFNMVQDCSGDAPNIGANDSTLLFPIESSVNRDFRPSIQLAMSIFRGKRAYDKSGSWNDILSLLNIPIPSMIEQKPKSKQYKEGGFSVLLNDRSFVLLRFPNFSFRPSQADSLHLDFWLLGENILRDAGSYSYNSNSNYFSGTSSHNTIEFDNRDQMPRLGNFLFGEWNKYKKIKRIEKINFGETTTASYIDYKGAYHERCIYLIKNKLKVIDTIKDFEDKAILRWRLIPSNWKIDQGTKMVYNDIYKIKIECSKQIENFDIKEGWESKYYLQKTSIPVLEVQISENSIISTLIEF